MGRNKGDKHWKNANSLFKRHSRCCRVVGSQLTVPITGTISNDDGDGNENSKNAIGDVTRDDSQRWFLVQHSAAMLAQCCNYSKECCNALLSWKSLLRIVSCNIAFRLAKNNCTYITLFLYISLPSLHDYNMKVRKFTFCRGREHKTTTFFFFSWTLIQSFRIQLQKNLPTFDELNEMEQAR